MEHGDKPLEVQRLTVKITKSQMMNVALKLYGKAHFVSAIGAVHFLVLSRKGSDDLAVGGGRCAHVTSGKLD